MLLRISLSTVILLTILATSVVAQSPSFEKVVQNELAKGKVPGFAVAVIKDGQTIYQAGMGYADIKRKTPVTTKTQFMIGSVTKQFTAMAIMILEEEGLVELDEKLRSYLPELSAAYDAVTVRHVLTHTSGIQSDFKKRSEKPFFNESLIGHELYEALSGTDLEFQPGDEIRYSNTGYSLLYMIIESVSQESYIDFLSRNIFDPLGMTRTTSRNHANSDIEGLATGYAKPKRKFREAMPVLRLGGGSIVSTVEDLAKWDAALLSEKLVSGATLERIWTPQILNSGEIANMGKDPQGRLYQPGFGWFIGDDQKRGLVHHSGGVDGFASNIDRYLSENLTVIVLCNIENDTAVSLTGALAHHYFSNK